MKKMILLFTTISLLAGYGRAQYALKIPENSNPKLKESHFGSRHLPSHTPNVLRWTR